MLMKTTYALIAALVLASTSAAFARAPRPTGVEQNGYPYSYNPNEEMRLDHAKGDIW